MYIYIQIAKNDVLAWALFALFFDMGSNARARQVTVLNHLVTVLSHLPWFALPHSLHPNARQPCVIARRLRYRGTSLIRKRPPP